MPNEHARNIPTIHTDEPAPLRTPLPPAANAALVLAMLATPLSVIGWVWTADWRWLVTGLMVTLALIVVAAGINGVKSRLGRPR